MKRFMISRPYLTTGLRQKTCLESAREQMYFSLGCSQHIMESAIIFLYFGLVVSLCFPQIVFRGRTAQTLPRRQQSYIYWKPKPTVAIVVHPYFSNRTFYNMGIRLHHLKN